MEDGLMALSTRDRDRLKVLSEAKKGLITKKHAAQHLDITERQIRRMVTRMSEQGTALAASNPTGFATRGTSTADLPACFPKIAELFRVQAFIAQAAVETFSECILNRLAWLDMGEVDPAIDFSRKESAAR